MNKLQGLTAETVILIHWARIWKSGATLSSNHPRRAFKVLYAVLLTSSLASCFVAFEAVARTSSPSASVP